MSGPRRRARMCRGVASLAIIAGGPWSTALAQGLAANLAAPQVSPCDFNGIAGKPLTLSSAIDLALCSNAEIQSAGAAIRVRAAELGQARSAYWPSLAATVTEVRENTRYPDSASSATTDTATTLYGTLSWNLLDFGGRRSEVRAASKLLEAALGTRDATVQKVFTSVVESYYDSVTAKALLDSTTEDTAAARETLASAERRLDRGDGARSDALQARTALARTTLDSNRALGTYEKSLALLAYSVGLAPGTRFEVPDELEAPAGVDEKSLAAWLEEASQRHPAIAAARAELEAARSQVISARSSGRPTLGLQMNYYANGFPQQGLATDRQRTATVGIAVSIPLFDGFLQRHKVHAAKAAVQVREALLVDTERVTLTEIVKMYSDATAAVANLREAQSLLNAARSSQESSKRRYEAGATDMLELLAAQTALADARQEMVRSVAELRSARLRLLATSGALSNGAELLRETN